MSDSEPHHEDNNGNPLSREARAYLAAIVSSSDDAIISKNLNGIITSWNTAAERMFGYSAAEAVGQHIRLIIPEERLPEENTILSSVSAGRKIDHFPTVRKAKDGHLIEVSLSVSPVRNDKGEIIGAAKIARDMGIAREAERASAYLSAIVASSDDAIVGKNLDGTITSWNAGAERIFGYSAEEAVGKHITLIIPTELREEETGILNRLRRGERIDHFETVRITKDGRLRNISITVSPIRDYTNTIIGASKVARDITDKKKAEEELNTQKQWFEVTLASIGDAVIATDTNVNITYLNSIAEKLTGWVAREALGKPLESVFNIVNEDSRLKVDHPIEKVIKTGVVQGLANHTMLIARDGTEYSIEDAAAPIRLPDGRLIGVVLVFHDIGERRLMEKELKRKAELLVEKDRRKDEFLAMLAHELRNPLAPISNALNIIKTKSLSAEVQDQAIDMAKRQLSHMVRLLDDLLDVSRITHGKVLMHHARTDLCEVIKTAIDTAKPLVHEQKHHLQMHMPRCPIWVNGDATRLAQLFGNLLNNAAKYTPKGGVITFTVLQEEREIVVRVKDDGIGIPEDKLLYIFDMFMQVDDSMERTQGGLGIGLTLVKNITELHGGTVEAYSEGKGKGTEFTVRLPILDNSNNISSQKSDKEELSSLHDSYRILIADDNEASAKTLGWMLEAIGHKVKLAYTAKETMEIASSYKPHVALLDIGMPDMNGYELCKMMRKDASLNHTIFIAQTGWGQEQHLQRSHEAGFDAHLIKPISMDVLQKQLETLKVKISAS